MKNKKRYTFKCWNCQKTYTLQREITAEQKWIVACPYCLKEAVVLLSFLPKKKTVFRGGQAEAENEELDLPEIIPTEAGE
ncbi:MAG: hypothetical protein L6461_24765 [Anaerolineae bacterium]|nr:hypothetical protein [Anaerolineae bacterium]